MDRATRVDSCLGEVLIAIYCPSLRDVFSLKITLVFGSGCRSSKVAANKQMLP